MTIITYKHTGAARWDLEVKIKDILQGTGKKKGYFSENSEGKFFLGHPVVKKVKVAKKVKIVLKVT